MDIMINSAMLGVKGTAEYLCELTKAYEDTGYRKRGANPKRLCLLDVVVLAQVKICANRTKNLKKTQKNKQNKGFYFFNRYARILFVTKSSGKDKDV